MTNTQKYEYIDEASIYSDLMCVICSEPFKNPVCTPCDHTFCHHCIRQWIEREDLSCPICRKTLLTIQLKQANRIIVNMLNRIHVKCIACGERGLKRGTFDNHIENECLKSDVKCLSTNLNCPWIGKRDELENHLETCIFYSFQPFVDKILYENEKNKDEICEIKRNHEENYFKQTYYIQKIHEYCETSTDELDENLIAHENQIENHEFQLVDYPIQIAHCFNRINQIEIENQQQNSTLLQCNQHETDIKQITIKLNLLKELLNNYQNSKLEECINKRESNSWIDLSRQELTDHDMEIVVRQAIINKQCKELDLRRNEIHSNGIEILMDELINNKTLEILYLSFNSISDMGVYYLIQTNSLKKLELDSNEITDQGAEYLSQMLKTNQILLWLSLDNNNITNSGMKLLANVLSNSNQRLQELYINGNKFIDDQSINPLITMIKQNFSMKKFSIENCGITRKGKIRLQQTVKYKKNFSLNV